MLNQILFWFELAILAIKLNFANQKWTIEHVFMKLEKFSRFKSDAKASKFLNITKALELFKFKP